MTATTALRSSHRLHVTVYRFSFEFFQETRSGRSAGGHMPNSQGVRFVFVSHFDASTVCEMRMPYGGGGDVLDSEGCELITTLRGVHKKLFW